MKIEAKIINTSFWIKISIVSVTEGYSQILKDGKWVNSKSIPERFEDEILTLSKCFSDNESAEKFMNTNFFKSLLKNIEKNWIA
jgi:hypothetical protein